MKQILILFFTLFVNLNVTAQDKYIFDYTRKIIPPSPSVYEFSKFGNIPVNGSTGGFNYSVPIYTIQSGDISLPISIGYYSNGVSIDALSGTVGINWNLNAGGVISRVVRDYPDELAGSEGRLYLSESEAFLTTNDTVVEKIKNIGRNTNVASFYDGEQDWFSFNVNGISGSFYFDKKLIPHISSEQNISISYERNNEFSKFIITDENGFKYVFGGDTNTIEYTTSYNQCDEYPPIAYTTGWLLKEIISPKNNSITFTYLENDMYYSTNLSTSSSISGKCNHPTLEFTPFDVNQCLGASEIKSKVISAINFQNNSVIFEYDSQRQDGGGKALKDIQIIKNTNTELIKKVEVSYDIIQARSVPISSVFSILGETGINYRMFLKEIKFSGNSSSINSEKYLFEYYQTNDLPIRLSYSKDKFGFNNGTSNSSPFSSKITELSFLSQIQAPFANQATANLEVNPDKVYYGMLRKITYPTGGYSEMTYESNKDTQMSEKEVPKEYTISLNKYCDNNTNSVTGSFEFVSNGLPLNFEAFTAPNGASCSIQTITDKYNIKIYKDNQIILNLFPLYGEHFNSDVNKQCFNNFSTTYTSNEPICTIAGSTYRVVVALDKPGFYGTFKIKYNGDKIQQTVYGGGVRIKEIADYTTGQSINKRTFYYNKLVDYLSENTTMKHAYEPYYYTSGTSIKWCPFAEIPRCIDYAPKIAFNHSISSEAINSNYLSRESISYSAITEIFETNGIKNGAIEKNYNISPSAPGRLIHGESIFGAPSDNYGNLYEDKIIEEIIYDDQNNPKSKKSYQYSIYGNNFLLGTVSRHNFILPLEPEWTMPTRSSQMSPPPPIICYDPTIFEPLINYSIWTYKNYYGIIKLDKATEITYLGANEIENNTFNTYGNAPSYLLTTTTTKNSKGEVLKTEYKYPSDLIGVEQTPYMQQLVDANRIIEPVITKTFNESTKLAENHTKYGNSPETGNLLLPTEMHTRKGTTDISITAIEDRKIQFTLYDTRGNIQEYKLENGTPVSIIWGYDKTQPIAKIENATYTEVSSYISDLQTKSNLDSDNCLDSQSCNEKNLRTALNSLRNDATYKDKWQVSTYTYDPLIGVTSMTDPKGYTIYYEYDTFNRLKQVKDQNGKIISANNYHYKNQ